MTQHTALLANMTVTDSTTFPFPRLAPELQQLVLNKYYEEPWVVNKPDPWVNSHLHKLRLLPLAPLYVSRDLGEQAKRAIADTKSGTFNILSQHSQNLQEHQEVYDAGISCVEAKYARDMDQNMPTILKRFINLSQIKISVVDTGYLLEDTIQYLFNSDLCSLLQRELHTCIASSVQHDLDKAFLQRFPKLTKVEINLSTMFVIDDMDPWPAMSAGPRAVTEEVRVLLNFCSKDNNCSVKGLWVRKCDETLSNGQVKALIDIIKGKNETEGWTERQRREFEAWLKYTDEDWDYLESALFA